MHFAEKSQVLEGHIRIAIYTNLSILLIENVIIFFLAGDQENKTCRVKKIAVVRPRATALLRRVNKRTKINSFSRHWRLRPEQHKPSTMV